MMLDKDEIKFGLYGLLLGDGTYKSGKIYCYHSNKQKFYVKWLETIFKENNLDIKCKYDYINKTSFGEYYYSQIAISVDKNEILNVFYDENNKKIISDYVLSNINEFGLLLWFLDDGQLHVSFKENSGKRFAYLNTQSFTYEENIKIQKMFKERFDIDLKIHKDNSGFKKQKNKTYYRLYFNATNFRKFFDVVRPYLKYIPKEFYYKFNMKYTPNRLKNSLEFSKKYNL